MKLNLGAGKKALPRAEGWLNVDKFEYPTTDEVEYRKMDLFRYPWDLPDNCVDEVLASHIIEHIPHEAKPNTEYLDEFVWVSQNLSVAEFTHRQERWEQLKDLDGFFAFFAELHRVCVNEAVVKIVCPFGYTRGAFQDPTHTRYIVPPTFHYLTSEENGNWDYHLPLKYKMVDVRLVIYDPEFRGLPKSDMDYLLTHQWDIAQDITAELMVVK